MWRLSNLGIEEKLRFENIIDMGLSYSAMMRNFQKGSKEKLQKQIVGNTAKNLFNITSEQEFKNIHSEFCAWGTNSVTLAERRRKGKIIKCKGPASYGQIAKTLDVTLKVAVYYCHLPDFARSDELCRWINAAVDTNMMYELQEKYPNEFKSWPNTIEKVDSIAYSKIQGLVRRAIKEWHEGTITPVQYDDIHWRLANEKDTHA